MTRALELAAPPPLVGAFMIGLDPAVEVAERTGGAKPAALTRKRFGREAVGPVDALTAVSGAFRGG